MPSHLVALLLAVAGLAVSTAAWADPPARVGRLSTIDGTVSMHMSDQDQWSPAEINYPVTTGTSFWTEPQARAELSIGPTAIHLDGGTELDVVALDDTQLLANAPQGRINLWVPSVQPNDFYSIATPRGSLEITAPGTFRITAGTDQDPTEVAVLEGSARLVGPTSTVALRAGEAATATGPNDGPSYSVGPTQPTPFDDAARADEHRERKLPARQYISPEMTGYEDLDDHGSWRTEADVGPVWYPQAVPADWEPYRYGHWAWIDPWGWTWIDDQPWGFAPFHYGRWSRIHDRWGWVPGRITPRPAYAPALVAFIGGAGWSIGLSLGADRPVGWFPLAPREVYVPPYSTSVSYARRVNLTNVVNVNSITAATIRDGHPANANFRNRNSAVVVRQSDFAASHPVARAALAVQPAALAAAPVTHQAAAIRASAPAGGGATPNAAPGPQIRHAERTPANGATPNAARGTAQPQAQAPAGGAPGPQIRRGGGAATANVAPAQRGAPAAQPQGQASPPAAAAPGPAIRRGGGATANVAPAERAAPAAQPPGQPTPPAAAAPGPPIQRRGGTTANVAPAERAAPAVQPQGQAAPPAAAAPGPPARRNAPPANAAPARREIAPPATPSAAAPPPPAARREERPTASVAPAARPAAPAAPAPREARPPEARPPAAEAARAAPAARPAPAAVAPPHPAPAPAPHPAPAAAPAAHPAPAKAEPEKKEEPPHP